MKTDIETLIDTVKSRQNNVLVISGNIYDKVAIGEWTFSDMSQCLEKLSGKKYPQFIKYDLFSGINVICGDSQEVLKQMGIKQDTKSGNNPDADLMNALRSAGMGIKKSEFPTRPFDVFQCLDSLLCNSDVPTFILIEYSQTIFTDDSIVSGREGDVFSIALTKWSRSEKINKNGHLVVLLCRDDSKLSQMTKDRVYGIRHIRIGKPTIEELEKFFRKKNGSATLAKIARSLSFNDLSKLDDLSVEPIMSVKRKILAEEYGDVLEVLSSLFGFNAIGGMEKQIKELKTIALNMKMGRTSAVPQGIFLVGPPGTGKTLVAQAMAKEIGINCVKPGNIKNMFVGRSEERQTRFINALIDLSPVIVFIDEFDQNQAQRGSYDGDSGVSRNLFQKLLTIMSDIGQRGKILWIIASNRPDLIDSAIKRPGRIDIRMPFLPPSNFMELNAICDAALIQYPDIISDINDWSKFTQKCVGYNGSYMVEIVLKAWRHAQSRDISSIQDEDMEWAVNDFIPPRDDIRDIARMSLMALLTCSSQSLMPDNWQDLVQKYTDILNGNVPDTKPDKVEVFQLKGSPLLN